MQSQHVGSVCDDELLGGVYFVLAGGTLVLILAGELFFLEEDVETTVDAVVVVDV